MSAWQVRDGEPPRLITAYPMKTSTPATTPAPLILNTQARGADYWSALWDLADNAARSAAARAIATPISSTGRRFRDSALR